MPGKGRGLFTPNGVRIGRSGLYYGPLSDVSFVLSTVKTLRIAPPLDTSPAATVEDISVISDLIDLPLNDRPGLDPIGVINLAYEIPHNARDLILCVLERRDLLLSFLAETQVLATATDPLNEFVTSESLSLLHSVLALAYLYDFGEHRRTSCQESRAKASRYFEISTGLNTVGHASGETSLATSLCNSIYLMAISRNSLAYSYISSACSSVMRLGLMSDHDLPEELPAQTRSLRSRLLATSLCLDMIGSIILDLPPSFRADIAPPSKMLGLARRAEDVDDLPTAVLLRQAALLAIPLSVRNDPGPRHYENEDDHQTRLFRHALHDFQKLASEAAPLMAKLADSEQLQRSVIQAGCLHASSPESH